MPVDFTHPEQATTPDPDAPMFAPTPLWDRAPKKRRAGARRAATRPVNDPAIDAGEPGAGAGVIGATTAAEPLDATYETQPAEIERSPRRRGVAVAVVAASVIGVAALGGAGWYASQPHARGVAQLTPGAPAISEPATSEIALSTAAPPVNPMTAPSAAPVAGESATTTPATKHAAPVPPRAADEVAAARPPKPRVRPADTSSALSSGVDASTTAPMVNTPSPAPSASPTPPVNPVNPAAPTPAPAPSTTAPPAGSIDDSAAPTASAPVNPTATP